MAKRKNNTRRRMARPILLVIGSRTLNHQVAHPMIKVTMRREGGRSCDWLFTISTDIAIIILYTYMPHGQE